MDHALPPIKPPPLHSSHTSFPIIVVAVIGILATAFLLVSYYVFVIKCCLNWHRIDLLRRFSFSRRRRVEEPLVVHSPALENRGLNEAAIRSIPIFNFQKVKEEKEASGVKSRECAVCLNEFVEEEKLRIIPNCGHFFHIDCIDIWLQNNANCPLCRTSISPARPDVLFPTDHQIISLSPSSPNPDSFTGRDEDYVVIEISEQGHIGNPALARIPSGELLSSPRKKTKKITSVASRGDECIDNRQKDEQFVVQPIRRSFSMDSAADSKLYLAVQELIQVKNNTNNNEINSNDQDCGSSRVKRSFFSFGGSRSAVQPVELET